MTVSATSNQYIIPKMTEISNVKLFLILYVDYITWTKIPLNIEVNYFKILASKHGILRV